jgi:hypothetical protein
MYLLTGEGAVPQEQTPLRSATEGFAVKVFVS